MAHSLPCADLTYARSSLPGSSTLSLMPLTRSSACEQPRFRVWLWQSARELLAFMARHRTGACHQAAEICSAGSASSDRCSHHSKGAGPAGRARLGLQLHHIHHKACYDASGGASTHSVYPGGREKKGLAPQRRLPHAPAIPEVGPGRSLPAGDLMAGCVDLADPPGWAAQRGPPAGGRGGCAEWTASTASTVQGVSPMLG